MPVHHTPPIRLDTYPLVFPDRKRTLGYYFALGLCIFVFTFIPAFIAYASWYLYAGYMVRGWVRPFAGIIFFYSSIEISFLLYLTYTHGYIRQPSPPSDLSSEECTALFMRVLQSGLGEVYDVDAVKDEVEESENEEEEESEEERTSREETEGSPSGYNLRQRTPKKPDPSFVYSPPPKQPDLPRSTSKKVTPRKKANPSNGGPNSPHKNAPTTVTVRRDSLSKDLSNQMHSILSGQGYTFAADISAAARSRRVLKSSGRVRQSKRNVLEDLKEGDGGMESPDVRVTRLERDDERAVEFRERMRSWFGKVPFEKITRHDMIEWLAWSSYNLPLTSVPLNSPSMRMLEDSLDLVEARCGWSFPDLVTTDEDPVGWWAWMKSIMSQGKDKVKLMRLTIDTVNLWPRPFFMYWVPGCFNWYLERIVYARYGMKVHREGALEYLLRIPEGWSKDSGKASEDPILYLHGLGFGLLQNHFVITQLLKTLPSHPIMVPLQPHISMQIFHPRHLVPLTRPETVTSIKLACERWGFYDESKVDKAGDDGIVILSHSNGSVGHGWLLKDYPGLARRSAFIDPVCFCLWEGAVCENFCYRSPRTTIEMLLYYFIASEIGIANTIQRHFDWSTNTLFFEEIPNAKDESRTVFFLGGKDAIVDAHRVQTYLNRHGVIDGIEMDQNAGHGDGLAGPALDRLIAWLSSGRLG